MFPYNVDSGRVQAIFGNLFSKTDTLQFYNAGFYLLGNNLTFVGGSIHFRPDLVSLCQKHKAQPAKEGTR